MPSTKAKLVKDFLCLIYDHKSMMIDTDETSYRKVYYQSQGSGATWCPGIFIFFFFMLTQPLVL
jgi:hypothetical protein